MISSAVIFSKRKLPAPSQNTAVIPSPARFLSCVNASAISPRLFSSSGGISVGSEQREISMNGLIYSEGGEFGKMPHGGRDFDFGEKPQDSKDFDFREKPQDENGRFGKREFGDMIPPEMPRGEMPADFGQTPPAPFTDNF